MAKAQQVNPLLPMAVALMAGIVAARWVQPGWWPFGVCLAMAFISGRWPRVQGGLLMACFAALGLAVAEPPAAAFLVPEGSTAEAVVVSEAAEREKTVRVDVLLVASGQELTCYLWKDRRSRLLKPGDGLLLRGPLEQRCFVRSANWQAQSVSLQRLSRLQRTRLWFLGQRHRLLDTYRKAGIDGGRYAVLAAMTLGDKSALTPALRDTYSVTGASHILALSGLHLGILYMLLSLLVVGRRLRLFSQSLAVLSLWAFALLTGLSTSVVRSATMLTVYALLSLGHRRGVSVNVLSMTAIIVLLFSPSSLYDIGFQLSFMSVFFILLWLPLMEGWLAEDSFWRHRGARWVWGMTMVSVAAQMGVAPLIAFHFGRFSTYFLFTNFVVVPAAMLILYLALLLLLMPWPPIAWLLSGVTDCLNGVLGWMQQLPFASVDGLHPSVLQVSALYVVLLAFYLLVRRLTGSPVPAGYR